MIEIKFRAWYEEEKEMQNVIDIYFNKNKGDIESFVTKGKKATYHTDVHTHKLMQYTGLKDKTHLKDIVFGDVVIVDSPKGPFKAKITQEIGAFGIVAIDGQIIDYFEDNWNDDFMALLDIYWNFNNDDNVIEEIEVIGNIYENPELLEVQNG